MGWSSVKVIILRSFKRFGMNRAQPLSTPMVVRSLGIKKDSYHSIEKNEVLGPKVPYLSDVGALMYLAQCTKLDTLFPVNLLARYSSTPTQRHWTTIKYILRYLHGIFDSACSYDRRDSSFVGYVNSGYLSDPFKGRSETGYVFLSGNTVISWSSTIQTLIATSSNHAEILALYEASIECVWLKSLI